MGRLRVICLVAGWAFCGAGACIAIAEGQGVPKKITDQDTLDGGIMLVDGSAAAADTNRDVVRSEPHQVVGVEPSHGPFSGGQRALIRGNGFASNARVWFGATEVPAVDVTPVDATRLQVLVPAGSPGSVSVRVQNGEDASTSRALEDGYAYDSFFAEPSSGPTSGGTVLRLVGMLTDWGEGTRVQLESLDCADVRVESDTEIRCTTPSHPRAAVAIRTTTGDRTLVVQDAFTYTDSDNGFRGGLSGHPLEGSLRVVVLDAYAGEPIPDATVIAGDSLDNALRGTTDASGVVVLSDQSLRSKRSVTIAKRCYQPTSFLDVPVQTVTAYLSPILSPDCAGDGGDIPPVGSGAGTQAATVQGELLWTGGTEFKRAPWTNVPAPRGSSEEEVAYVFSPQVDPAADFVLPPASTAVRPNADGTLGYAFSISARPGNTTLYALAGLEDRSVSPARFVAYAFGVVRGVATRPGGITDSVFVPMNAELDKSLVLSVTPPTAGPRGPDRIVASACVRLGPEGYALFPNIKRSLPLASTGPLALVGLPGLDGALTGMQFLSSANAVTGASAGVPKSVVGGQLSTDTSMQVDISGFVQLPVLRVPEPTQRFDGTHIAIGFSPGVTVAQVTVVRISSAGGLVEWLVVAPDQRTDVQLPDLRALGLGLPPGPISIEVSAGHVADPTFEYSGLLYRHTDRRGWDAYSSDVFNTYY